MLGKRQKIRMLKSNYHQHEMQNWLEYENTLDWEAYVNNLINFDAARRLHLQELEMPLRRRLWRR